MTSFRIRTDAIPFLPGAFRIFEKGSIPGACFRNREFSGKDVHFTRNVGYTATMLVHDAQTSGGLLMAVPPDLSNRVLKALEESGSGNGAALIGEVLEESPRRIYFE